MYISSFLINLCLVNSEPLVVLNEYLETKKKMERKMRNIFWQWQIKGKQFIIRWDEEEEVRNLL